MKFSRWAPLLAAAPLVAAGCGNFGKSMTAHTDVVARAAGKELKVDEAASILAANPMIEPNPQIVADLADYWVDYTLLATAAAEDTTLSVLDLDKLIEPERDDMVLRRLIQTAVRPDTVFTDAELVQAWGTQGPGTEVRARHILLRYPADPTPAQRDSVKRMAESLRARAAGGEDFAGLARQFSADGSAQQGGDLGFFGRGRMVAPFEEAAFALQPGQISPVVESPFGLHVIKVEEKRQQEMGEQKEGFRRYLIQRSQQDATKKYFDSLTAAAQVQVEAGAAKTVKELAEQGNLSLRGRAASRELVSYRGGEVTASEVAEQLSSIPTGARKQFAESPDTQVVDVLRQLATKEILLRDAKTRNVALSAAETDTLRRQAREAIREILRSSGLNQQRRVPKGDAGNAAIEEQVRTMIQQMVTGQRQLPPLGTLGRALRGAYGAETYEGSFARVADKLKSIRATQPQPPMPQGAPQPGQPQGQVPQQQVPQPQPQAPAQPQGGQPKQ